MIQQPKTLFQKIWDSHVVAEEPGAPAVLYIDLHYRVRSTNDERNLVFPFYTIPPGESAEVV